MKQKLLSALLMTAFAGVATTASAGVIQASYKNYAAEVFGTNTVTLTAPTISYALALPLSGLPGNPNQFNIAWTLTDGKWAAAPAVGNIQLIRPDNTGALNASTVSLSADGKTLTASFTVTDNYTVGSQIILGSGGPVTVTEVGTKLGAPAANSCVISEASVDVTVKLTNAAGNEFESNFNLAPLKNTDSIARSAVALSLTALSSSAYSRTTAGAVDTDIEQSRVNVLTPSLGRNFTNAPVDITGSTTVANLGQLVIGDRAPLFDLSGAAPYSVSNANWGVVGPSGDGRVEHNGVTFKVTGRFATGATITLNQSTTVLGATTIGAVVPSSVTFNAARTEATVTVAAADLTAVALDGAVRRLNVIYTVNGTAVVPVAQFAISEGSLAKAATTNELPNAVCPGNIYNLRANGVQVDVRNYIPAIVEAPSGGWKNVVRIINTDESQPSVDVIGTALLADGTLGATGIIAAGMKPREVRYLSGAQIDTVLNAAATALAPTFGANDIPANARLRITAPSASIRVQNYHFNPATGNYLEASAAQGDEGPDYTTATSRDNK